MRLALSLGKTKRELLAEMDSPELSEWLAFYEYEPWGQEWMQTAYVCSMIGNSQGGKRGGGSFAPRDFLPICPPEESEESVALRQKATWRVIQAQCNARHQYRLNKGDFVPPVGYSMKQRRQVRKAVDMTRVVG